MSVVLPSCCAKGYLLREIKRESDYASYGVTSFLVVVGILAVKFVHLIDLEAASPFETALPENILLSLIQPNTMKSYRIQPWLLMLALIVLGTFVFGQTSNPVTGKRTIEAESGHLNYLVVDSALRVGDSSIYIVYSTPQDPYNYIYSDDGPLLINGRNGQLPQNTFINPLGASVGIGYMPTTMPGGPRFAVNGSGYFAGHAGINKIPNLSTRLAIVAPQGETALEMTHQQTTPYGYAQKMTVSNPLTKSMAVTYNDGNANTPDPETFVVLGNGVTNIGGYQEAAQLSVRSGLDIGCRVKITNLLPGKVAYLAEVPNDEAKALSIVNTSNANAPKEVYRITGAGVAWMQEIRVRVAPFPDYVFQPDYKLMDLYSLEQYIQTHHRLPGMPSAKEVEAESANLGELVRLQQEKIEELTLHLIALQKSVDDLRNNAKQ